jgi:hypothetical protein
MPIVKRNKYTKPSVTELFADAKEEGVGKRALTSSPEFRDYAWQQAKPKEKALLYAVGAARIAEDYLMMMSSPLGAGLAMAARYDAGQNFFTQAMANRGLTLQGRPRVSTEPPERSDVALRMLGALPRAISERNNNG